MREAFNDVHMFMEAVGQAGRQIPGFPDEETIGLRKRLIEEEVRETLEAVDERDLVEVADGIADSIYVLVGTAVAFGIPLGEVWRRVQAANMAKVSGPVRADGKRLKPEGWTPPDVAGALDDAGWKP